MDPSDEQRRGGAAPKAAGTQATDLNLALERVGGDEELLSELAVLFLEDYPRQLIVIADAIARGDLKTAEREAHSVKGAVANFGAAPASEAARALEFAARDGRKDALTPGLERLRQELALVHVELARLTGSV
jgi:HPt (histidine-containing phosphotransfer) domain-containing protein